MTTCTKSINIYYSQVTLLLQCLISYLSPFTKKNSLLSLNLTYSVRHVQRVECSTSIYIRKVALQSANNEYNERDGQRSPGRVAYFLNELRQSVVHTACKHICNCLVQSLYSSASLKSFVVERPPVPKYRTSLIDSVSIPRKPYTTIWFYKLLILVLHYQHFSYHSPHFSAAEISRTTLLRHTS